MSASGKTEEEETMPDLTYLATPSPTTVLEACSETKADARRSNASWTGAQPKVKSDPKRIINGWEEGCVICQDEYDVDRSKRRCRLICGHMFHSDCIRKWLGVMSTCPFCRRSAYYYQLEDEKMYIMCLPAERSRPSWI